MAYERRNFLKVYGNHVVCETRCRFSGVLSSSAKTMPARIHEIIDNMKSVDAVLPNQFVAVEARTSYVNELFR